MVTSITILQQEFPAAHSRFCFFAAAVTQQQLTAEQPLPGQVVLLFCSCHYSTAAHSSAAYARLIGAGVDSRAACQVRRRWLLFCSCHYSTAAHSRAAYARPGGAAFFSYHYSTDHAPVPLLQLTLGKTPIRADPLVFCFSLASKYFSRLCS
jgi:hypothetical protein